MKTAVLMALTSAIVLNLISCGEKKEEAKSSHDQDVYAAFKGEAFTEKESSIQYEETSKYKHTLLLANDQTLEIRYNVNMGYILPSALGKVYSNKLEAIEAAGKIATEKLTPQDSKEKWEQTESEARKKVEAEIIAVPCSLVVKGKNLVPRADKNVTHANEKGRIATMDFEVVEIKGDIIKSRSTPEALTPEAHVKACQAENFLSFYKSKSEDGSKSTEEIKYLFMNWFELSGGDSFVKATKGKLSFNHMSHKELRYGDIVLEKK
jgi:hypothetical protein